MSTFGKRGIKVLFGAVFLVILLAMNAVMGIAGVIKKDEIIVVIDAGHGGNDPGKVSQSGILEKDVNLSIAFKVKESLEKEGIIVIMTRENDVNLATPGATNKKSSDMANRVELINGANPRCLISIHQNSYTDPDVRGAQVFYCGESEESKKIAEILQKNIVDMVDENNKRKTKEGNDYYILKKTVCPGVILECGFLSSPEETALLIEESYQEKIAEAIVSTIIQLYK